MELLIILSLVFSVWAINKSFEPKTDYFYGRRKAWYKEPEPFIEYDKDGFITEESYKSHIYVTTYGPGKGIGFGVDPNVLSKTRKFKEQCEAVSKLVKNRTVIKD
jgi:hypothetical protein